MSPGRTSWIGLPGGAQKHTVRCVLLNKNWTLWQGFFPLFYASPPCNITTNKDKIERSPGAGA
jgi:hypothetical protein